MVEQNKTSRHYILDLIEYIANTIALISHYQELLFQEDIEKELKIQIMGTISVLNEQRRNAMLRLSDSGGDHKYRCIVKHSISVYQFASEVYLATNNTQDFIAFESSYRNMIASVSLYLGIEMVTCGRCLSDKLHTNG